MLHYQYNNNHGIGSVLDNTTGMKASCVLTNKGHKRAAQLAYLGARLSRDNNPIEEIVQAVEQNNTDSDKRMETISHNYGHSSVGDMAQINVFFENIPMITAMQLFYKIPVLAGQENSSRYISFDNWSYVEPNIQMSEGNKQLYHTIMNEWKQLYLESQPVYKQFLENVFVPTNSKERKSLDSRVLDCARHFLPIGITTNLMITTSARQWSKTISQLKASGSYVNLLLGNMLYNLLADNDELARLGYVPEAPGLIRHSEPSYHLRDIYLEVKDYLLNVEQSIVDTPQYKKENYGRSERKQVHSLLLSRYLTLLNTTVRYEVHQQSRALGKIESIVNLHCDHHHELDNIGDWNADTIESYIDVGSIKDFNRHRSVERFIPLLETTYCLDTDPNRFVQAAYIEDDGFVNLQATAKHTLHSVKQLQLSLMKEKQIHTVQDTAYLEVAEWIKHLLPHGYVESAQFGFSFKDLIYFYHLRSRPGGHINYRMFADSYKQLLYSSITGDTVDVYDREQFFSRA